MLEHTFKVKSLTKKHNKQFSLSLLSWSLFVALSVSNSAHADCTKDTSDPNRTVFHCSGEINDKDIDDISKITGNVTIYNTGNFPNHASIAFDRQDKSKTQNTELISTGGKLGGIAFNGGNDTLTLFNTEISDAPAFDGDLEAEEPSGLNDTININQDFHLESGALLQNWEIINIGKEAKSYFLVDHPYISDSFSDIWRGESLLNIGPLGIMAYAPSIQNLTVNKKNMINEGIIDASSAIDDEFSEAKLIIRGNYEGKPGSKIFINSLWTNPHKALKASIIIDGQIKGESELFIADNILDDASVATENKDGLVELPVIIVKNKTLEELENMRNGNGNDEEENWTKPEGDAPVFTASAQTLGIRDAYIKRLGNKYYWSLKFNGQDLISKTVIGYIQQPYINQQMMQDQFGKLHERIANIHKSAEKQVWVRTNHGSTKLNGQERFSADVKSNFIQIGGDMVSRQNQENQQRTGLMFTYSWANSTFSDQYKVEKGKIAADKFTGNARANILSVGGYHTYYAKDGLYVDSVAQLSWLQNRYDSFGYKAKQHGWGIGASVEVGKSFPILNPKLAIEPQAQLIYQRIWFDGFTDGIKKVQQHNQDRLTARLGGRLIWTENFNNKASELYFSANLIQTLKGNKSGIQIGRESISENYGKLSAEFGVGGEYPISSNLSLYANVRHVMGLQQSKSYKGQIGLSYRF